MRQLQLLAAVAALRAEDVAGQALAVHAHQDRLAAADVAEHERDVLVRVRRSPCRRCTSTRRTPSEARVSATRRTSFSLCMRYWISCVTLMIFRLWRRAKRLQLRQPRHRAVLVHDLAEHARRIQARRACRDRPSPPSGRRGPARRPRARAAGRCGRACTRSFGRVFGSMSDLHRAGAVRGRDAGRHAVARLDATVNGVPKCESLWLDHHRDVQLLEALARHRHADQAAAVAGHEVDRLGRDELRRDREVAFVLAVFVIDDDDEAAVAVLLDRFFDGRQAAWRAASSLISVAGPVARRPLDPRSAAAARAPPLSRRSSSICST